MPESGLKDGERRRSPRFACGGRATIQCLPFEGVPISGVLRDLSVGGICLEVAEPVEPGARTEVVVSVNAASFRAAALVTGPRAQSGTCLQFLKMSAGGKDVLADMLDRLAKLQALNRKLRASHMDAETARMLKQSGRFPLEVMRRDGGVTSARGSSVLIEEAESEIFEMDSPLIRIDFFG